MVVISHLHTADPIEVKIVTPHSLRNYHPEECLYDYMRDTDGQINRNDLIEIGGKSIKESVQIN